MSAVNRGATVSTERDYSSPVLRGLPAIDKLLDHPDWGDDAHLPHSVRREASRAVVDAVRTAVLSGSLSEVPPLDELVRRARTSAQRTAGPKLVRVVNATGVILHTNLGRAPLAAGALDAIRTIAGGYTNLEMDLWSGKRDSRHGRLTDTFSRVIGCEEVVVANNCAAAVFLALSALAGGGAQVVVSRGELVEIGGSFRMPAIMEASGAKLHEVGATNRTHLRDYEAALDAGARIVMKVHRSNFAQVGFTKEVSIEELGALCSERGALLLHDLGMGVLDKAPGSTRGADGASESVRRSLDAGAQAVLFSGDKMLGGPQAGIIAGSSDVLTKIRKHPVMRLVRPGKLCLLALEATMRAWEMDPTGALLPAARMLSRDEDALRADAESLGARLARLHGVTAEVVPTASTPGGGSLPGMTLPSWGVAVTVEGLSATSTAAALREAEAPIVARIEDDRVLIDVRTLLAGDADAVVQALSA
ncbi:MAG: L-seryl-tRNA(Sec) selenium transferase [Deltaproteobacteria bacterium]|nr:L-seryl-tRNA(Sec) selenium transferase [Deltaproteobacteria bacterium]